MSAPVKRVLCADDHLDTCLMLANFVRLRGHEAVTAHSVQEALEAAGREQFDLFVIDKQFPGESGVELCRRLRAIHPEAAIILYSAAVSERDHKEAMEAGASLYVDKPDVESLVDALRRLLR